MARLSGLMTSYTTAMSFSKLFTHHLDIQKIDALKEADDNYNGMMTLDVTSRDDINWWIAHLDSEFAYIKTPELSVTLCTDASLDGWGVTLWEAVLLEGNGKQLNQIFIQTTGTTCGSLCPEVTCQNRAWITYPHLQ